MLWKNRSGEFVVIQDQKRFAFCAPCCYIDVLRILEEGVQFADEFWNVTVEVDAGHEYSWRGGLS